MLSPIGGNRRARFDLGRPSPDEALTTQCYTAHRGIGTLGPAMRGRRLILWLVGGAAAMAAAGSGIGGFSVWSNSFEPFMVDVAHSQEDRVRRGVPRNAPSRDDDLLQEKMRDTGQTARE